MTGRIVESTTDKPELTAKLQKSIDKPVAKTPAPDAKAVADKAAKAASEAKAKAEAAAAASGAAETTATDGTTEEVTADETDAGNAAGEGGETVETQVSGGEGTDKTGKEGQAGKGIQKRIDKLTKQKAQEAADKEFWKNEYLKLKATSTPGEKKVDVPTKTDDGKPRKEQFKNEEEYLDKLTDWKMDQREKAKASQTTQDQVRSAREKLFNEHNTRATEFQKAQADYNSVLSEVDDIQLPLPSLDLIMKNSRGPEIAYAMAKDRDNFARIAKLDPVAFAEEIGAIKAKLGTPSKGNPTKTTTGAAPPIRSVGGSAVLPKKTLREVGNSEDSQQQWRALRKQGVRQ